MTPCFILPARHMFHLQRAIADEAEFTRFYLSGVYVEPIPGGGAFLVATDGHVMLIHRARTATATRTAILKVCEPALPDEFDEYGERIERRWEGHHIHIGCEISEGPVAAQVTYRGGSEPYMHVLAEEVAGKFPDWRKTLSTDFSDYRAKLTKGQQIDHLDPRKLGNICSMWRGARVTQLHPRHPYLVTMEDDPDTLAVLAPRAVKAADLRPLDDMLAAIGRQDILPAQGDANG